MKGSERNRLHPDRDSRIDDRKQPALKKTAPQKLLKYGINNRKADAEQEQENNRPVGQKGNKPRQVRTEKTNPCDERRRGDESDHQDGAELRPAQSTEPNEGDMPLLAPHSAEQKRRSARDEKIKRPDKPRSSEAGVKAQDA